MRHKKGIEMSLWILLEALVIAVFIILSYQWIDQVDDDTIFEQRFLARDIALMANTIGSLPNAEYEYNLTQFEVGFNDGVTIKKEQIEATYPFYIDNDIPSQFMDSVTTDRLVFTKGTVFQIHNGELQQQACPDFKTTVSFIVYDPNSAADYAVLQAAVINKPNSFTQQNDPISPQARLAAIPDNTDVLVSLKAGEPKIEASKTDESRKLACLLKEYLKYPVVETDDELLSKVDGAAVRIHYQESDGISSAISAAVRHYNG